MNRFIVVCSSLLILAAALLITPDSVQSQIPPTNTKRPEIPTLPPTNTPRNSVAPTEDNSEPVVEPTLIPSKTTIPTRTPIPSRTPIPTRTATQTRTRTFTPTVTPTTIGPINYPDNINPLTGQPYPDDAAKNRRNLIVKVSNYTWVVRPQAGLSEADIVWEYEVEGGVTRFAAIYRSQGSEHVGSVRSGRLLDLELVTMYQGLLAYSGSNDNIKKMILEGSCLDDKGGRITCEGKGEPFEKWRFQAFTPQFGDNCPPFCRFPQPGLAFEHTMFANTYQLWELAAKRGVNQPLPARGFAFADEPPATKKSANDIFINWFGDQDARWQYNPQDNKYYRWNTGLPHIDANTGKQLTTDNIVVIQALHRERRDVYESESGSPAVEVAVWGQEKAWVFRDGKWYEGIWMRRNRERGALQLISADGKTPILLKPGRTWIEVVRCCNMNGVDATDKYADVQATATFAALTATAKGPHLSSDNATRIAPSIDQTSTVSAATAGFKGTPVAPTKPNGGGNGNGATPTPASVGG